MYTSYGTPAREGKFIVLWLIMVLSIKTNFCYKQKFFHTKNRRLHCRKAPEDSHWHARQLKAYTQTNLASKRRISMPCAIRGKVSKR